MLADKYRMEMVEENRQLIILVEVPGKATLSAPPSVPAGSNFKVQWEGPDSRNDDIALYRKKKHEPQRVDDSYTQKGNPAPFVAPGKVGDYELGHVHAHTGIVIGPTDIKDTPVQARAQAPASVDVAVDFEVRHILGWGYKLIDKTTIQITP